MLIADTTYAASCCDPRNAQRQRDPLAQGNYDIELQLRAADEEALRKALARYAELKQQKRPVADGSDVQVSSGCAAVMCELVSCITVVPAL